jgi:hypothetical protein
MRIEQQDAVFEYPPVAWAFFRNFEAVKSSRRAILQGRSQGEPACIGKGDVL